MASLENLEDISSLVAQLRAGSTGDLPLPERRPPATALHLSASGATDSGVAKKKAESLTPPVASLPPATERPVGAIASLESAGEIWDQARGALTGLLADFAGHGAITAISAPNRLVVSFPAKYNSSKVACERPQNLATLEQAVGEAAGLAVKLELTLAPVAEALTSPQAVVSPRQQRAQTAEHPMVRQVSEVFKAQVVRVDSPESSS